MNGTIETVWRVGAHTAGVNPKTVEGFEFKTLSKAKEKAREMVEAEGAEYAIVVEYSVRIVARFKAPKLRVLK